MRDPWLVIAIGLLCVVVPILISRWEGGRAGRPGSLRERVQTSVRSEPHASYFATGIRIGVELAGVVLVGIGVMRMFGIHL
jgi:hypothetical protein